MIKYIYTLSIAERKRKAAVSQSVATPPSATATWNNVTPLDIQWENTAVDVSIYMLLVYNYNI
jgi:hypothetical protein